MALLSKLSFLDRYLTLWIFMAMVIGVFIGHYFPMLTHTLQTATSGTTNIPLAIGLIGMMYPPLAKVDYSKMGVIFKDLKLFSLSFVMTWIIAPMLMFVLSVLFFENNLDYRVGLMLIGVAPCIAMVVVWNDLASGDRSYIAALVAFNSLMQLFFYASYAYFYIYTLPESLGLPSMNVHVEAIQVFETVLIYLGIPFFAGFISRILLPKFLSIEWYQSVYLPKISPVTLIALLITIVLMFALQGKQIIEKPMEVFWVSIPMILFFIMMFMMTFFMSKWLGANYAKNAALSFTSTGNNFELAIAVSIALFGLESKQAFVGVIGPLIEVPVLLALVWVLKYFQKRYYTV
jgi:ACR3 family arsenite transporter